MRCMIELQQIDFEFGIVYLACIMCPFHSINYLRKYYTMSKSEAFSNHTYTTFTLILWAMSYEVWALNRHHHPFGIQFTILWLIRQVISIHLNSVRWNHLVDKSQHTLSTLHLRDPWYSNRIFLLPSTFIQILCAKCFVYCRAFTLQTVSGSYFFFLFRQTSDGICFGACWVASNE